MYKVKDKIFLITGAASGIGAGMARRVAEKGAKHIAILDINEKQGLALESQLNKKYGDYRVKFHKCDITTDELDKGFDETVKQFGYIDTVVNNAGIMDDSPAMYLKEIQINLTALIRSSLKAYNIMRKDKNGRGGTIMNVSSVVGLFQPAYVPIYAATKTAVLQFSNCLGAEQTYKRTGVRVAAICFGRTGTNLISNIGTYDEAYQDTINTTLDLTPIQSVESAVNGFLVAYEKGISGGTWLITADKPAEDITQQVRDSYKTLSSGVFIRKITMN